jgi:hypothetical protein
MNSLPLPEGISYISRSEALKLLYISKSQLKRDVAVLQELEPIGWHYQANSRGFRREAIEILWEFRQLVQVMGRKEAIAQINQLIEKNCKQTKLRPCDLQSSEAGSGTPTRMLLNHDTTTNTDTY